jgi:hypothetical protein
MYSEVIDDEKVRMLAFEDRWHYVALLCLKCSGLLDSDDDASFLNRRIGVKLGLQQIELENLEKRLKEVRLIGDNWQPTGWDKRQFKSDKDNTTAERQRRYRENHSNKSNVTDSNALLTRLDTDTESDTDISTSLCSVDKPKAKRATAYPEDFIPCQTAMATLRAANIPVSAEHLKFKDYCLANGKTYKDWSAAFRNWANNAVEWKKPAKQSTNVQDARLDVANQIMGGRNGTYNTIIDINPTSTNEGDRACLPENVSRFR